MRTANPNGRLVVITDDGTAIDVEKAGDGRFSCDPRAVFDRWEEFRDGAGTSAARDAERLPHDEGQLGAPVPRPRQIFEAAAVRRSRYASRVPTSPR
ncbi:hypothetical protein [Streptomyces sp. AgN23]|uniref:hypothetical protein n=1 Tax=Streptomyces TaxID=1883 RepID=UPI001424B3F6|nr:hypothetical protein [Streptomyces sp. AgN23]AJZ87124.1 hypothetical protein AS97_25530 [Streptomyces sp. AgN23]WTB09902.1 hypothetical protein OG546_40615 [Streptomyces antimycoticus]